MIEPSFRLPLAALALTIVVLGAWRFTGGKPLSLPGDIRYEGEGYRVHFPVVSCLLLSALGNIVMWAFQRRGRGGVGGGGGGRGGDGAGGSGVPVRAGHRPP